MADQRDFLSELSSRTRFKGNRFEEALIQGDPYGLLDAPQPYNYGRAQFRGVDACQPEQNDIGFAVYDRGSGGPVADGGAGVIPAPPLFR
jgi:hypothetical protein